jgi:cell division protein FtsI (penicillin-binding protein 3)
MLAESVAANIKDKHANSGKVEGLRIAGKTGTAQKLENGRYSGYKTVASFIGFFPAEKPQYISLVVIDDPKTDGGWGDTVAGPLFNQVANYCRNLYL